MFIRQLFNCRYRPSRLAATFIGTPRLQQGPASRRPADWSAGGEGKITPTAKLGLNNGILQTGATFAPGEVGAAFVTSGSAVVSVPNSPTLDIPNGGSLTIQAWAFSTSSNSPQQLD